MTPPRRGLLTATCSGSGLSRGRGNGTEKQKLGQRGGGVCAKSSTARCPCPCPPLPSFADPRQRECALCAHPPVQLMCVVDNRGTKKPKKKMRPFRTFSFLFCGRVFPRFAGTLSAAQSLVIPFVVLPDLALLYKPVRRGHFLNSLCNPRHVQARAKAQAKTKKTHTHTHNQHHARIKHATPATRLRPRMGPLEIPRRLCIRHDQGRGRAHQDRRRIFPQ